ncbi:MAG: D-arabinono-1,4-lactone oxidase [Bacteroidota bacterium]
MKNWAGNIRWQPTEVAYPTTEAAVQQLVFRAANDGKRIRVIGTGHSFSPVCPSEDILVSLDRFQGLVQVDQNTCQATVKAGTKLRLLGELLFQQGMAMENLGDIDVQSIAGTISTGTHGTGTAFGTISTQVIALKFVNGKGEIISCSATNQPDLFKAAQVSLGALGIITEVTLQCVPLYKLRIDNQKEQLTDLFTNLEERLSTHRNFEFYWFPYTQFAATKTTDIVEKTEVDQVNFFNYWTEYVLENLTFKLLCEYANWLPSQTKSITRLIEKALPKSVTKIAHSHKVYATQRWVKFLEMEYSIPAEAYHDVWQEIQAAFKKHQFPIIFPIENRWVKGDDVYMSPAYGRDSAYIACHVYNKQDHRHYFKVLEDIFKAYDGRPHWGKMNTWTTEEVAARYPMFEAFQKQREAHDPQGIFCSDYMQELLGVPKRMVA